MVTCMCGLSPRLLFSFTLFVAALVTPLLLLLLLLLLCWTQAQTLGTHVPPCHTVVKASLTIMPQYRVPQGPRAAVPSRPGWRGVQAQRSSKAAHGERDKAGVAMQQLIHEHRVKAARAKGHLARQLKTLAVKHKQASRARVGAPHVRLAIQKGTRVLISLWDSH